MTAVYVADQEERRTYIGASDAAAALGLSPWGDPIGLAMEKWGEGQERRESFRMNLGKRIEPLIGDLYRDETGRKLRAGGARTRRMKGHPWIGAHPDFYVVGEPGVVQAKLSYSDFDEGVPIHYRIQAITEIAITGAEWLDFAVLDARSFQIFRVIPKPGEVEDLVADLDDYWNDYIVPRVLPPATANSGEALARRYPKHAEKIGKLASAAQAEKLAALAAAKEQTKAAKAIEDTLANEIKGWIGSAHYIEGDGYRATWSRWESTKVDYEPIAKAYRAIIEKAQEADEIVSFEEGVESTHSIIIDADLDAIESIYTRKEPGNRLTVSTPKEKK